MVNLASPTYIETGGIGIHKEGFLGMQGKHNWAQQRDARTEVNASNVEQLLACIDVEENSIFKLCSGLIDDWKEEVKKSLASGLSDTHTWEWEQWKTDFEAKTINSFEGLNAIGKDCADRSLNLELSELQLKVKNKIE